MSITMPNTLVCAGLLVAGCSTSSFSGAAKKTVAPAPAPAVATQVQPVTPPTADATAQQLQLNCVNGQGSAHLVTDVHGAKSTSVRLAGQFCGVTGTPTGSGLTVLFILDYSGSMYTSDPSTTGTCGRLQAGQTILKKLQATAAQYPAANIQVGMIAFGTDTIPGVDITSLASFAPSLTVDSFCRHDGGATNYAATFADAQSKLQQIQGQKAIYFITDGVPTMPIDSDPYQAGLTAANSLRTAVPNLTLNAVFLNGDPSDPTVGSGSTLDPNVYLAQVAGNAANVRVVASADQLAAQIGSFQNPTPTVLDQTSSSGTVSAANFGQTTVTITSLTADPQQPGVWDFVTAPFMLQGTSTAPVDNKVSLTIKGSDGKSYSATADLNFTADGP